MQEQQVACQTGKEQAGRDSREMLEQQVVWKTVEAKAGRDRR